MLNDNLPFSWATVLSKPLTHGILPKLLIERPYQLLQRETIKDWHHDAYSVRHQDIALDMLSPETAQSALPKRFPS